MARKVFQISFILLIIAAFGTVFNHYIKHKISDPNDYLNYIELFPQQRISRIDPIVINLAQEFNKVEYALNIPLDAKIISIDPEVKGTLLLSDTKTLEFYPDEPLKSDASYMVKIDLNKIFKATHKIKTFQFMLNTFKQQLYINIAGFTPLDSTLTQQELRGSIIFNDFIDIDDIYELFKASQKKRNIAIQFTPGNTKYTYLFKVEPVIRAATTDSLILKWNSKEFGLMGSKTIEIPGLNQFDIVFTEFIVDTLPRLSLTFSDPISSNTKPLQFIQIKGAVPDSAICNKQRIIVYFNDSVPNQFFLYVSDSLKNILGVKLANSVSKIIKKETNEPTIRLGSSPSIVAGTQENFYWEFQAKRIDNVDIQIYKIFNNTILQFLQTNAIQEINQIERVGKIVYQQNVQLSSYLQYNPEKWVTYPININDFSPQEGCIYSVIVNYTHPISGINQNAKPSDSLENNSFEKLITSDSLANNISIHQNIYYTNLGVFAKSIADSLYVWVTDIQKSIPVKSVDIEVLNYQQQIIAKTKSGIDGLARIKLHEDPCFVIAINGKQRSYLKIEKPYSKAQSETIHSGYFFQNRQKWEPGDTLLLAFISNINDFSASASSIAFNVLNEDKKKIFSQIKLKNSSNIYAFKYPIPINANNGKYTVEVIINKNKSTTNFWVEQKQKLIANLKLESISETETHYNYELSLSQNIFSAEGYQYKIQEITSYTPWLAQNYLAYTFSFDAKKKRNENYYSGYFNNLGNAIIQIEKGKTYPNYVLHHTFHITLINNNFAYQQSITKQIYDNNYHIGLSCQNQTSQNPKGFCSTFPLFNLVLLDGNQELVNNNCQVQLQLFKISEYYDTLLIDTQNLFTDNGQFTYQPSSKYIAPGKFIVRAQCLNTQAEFPFEMHFTDNTDINAFNKLVILTQNNSYYINDSLAFTLDTKKAGNALIVLENQKGIHTNLWRKVKPGKNSFKIKITPELFPEVLINAYLFDNTVQYQKQTALIKINKPDSILNPIIFAPHEAETENMVSFSIKEKNGKACSYMIAIFPTDNSQKELSNINSFFKATQWFKAYENNLFGENIIYNGFSYELPETEYTLTNQINTPFKVFEQQIGPFYLAKNQSRTHNFMLPQYIGNLKIRIVAHNSEQNLHGEASHIITANKPLMLMTWAPESISPNEELYLPIQLYSSRKENRLANIQVTDINALSLIDDINKKISINNVQAESTGFELKAKQRTGNGNINITATDSAYFVEKRIDLPIKSNNWVSYQYLNKELEPKAKWRTRFAPLGVMGTNNAVFEYTVYKNIHIYQLLAKLKQNKHNDLEHIISSAYPLMFIKDLTQIDIAQQQEIESQIQETINQLINYQTTSGGFSYWPNASTEHTWCSSYVGYFMIEARKKGYTINMAVYNKWLRYQRHTCLTWNSSLKSSDMEQAFGLYTLVLAEKPDLNNMDKMASKPMSYNASMLLSMAYAIIGQGKKSNSILRTKEKYAELNEDLTFGNKLRNVAIECEAFQVNNNRLIVDSLLNHLFIMINQPEYQSSQAISFALVSIAKAIKYQKLIYQSSIAYNLNNAKEQEHKTSRPYGIVNFPIDFTLPKSVDITNLSNYPLQISIDYSGQPNNDFFTNSENGINASLNFTDANGNLIQATDIQLNEIVNAHITVKNRYHELVNKQMVLVFPLANCFQLADKVTMLNGNIDYEMQSTKAEYIYFTIDENEISVKIPLQAIFKGRYEQSPIKVEALYAPQINATLTGKDYHVK